MNVYTDSTAQRLNAFYRSLVYLPDRQTLIDEYMRLAQCHIELADDFRDTYRQQRIEIARLESEIEEMRRYGVFRQKLA